MITIAPSILSADFSELGAEVRAVEAAGADWIHLDVMDGHFVPNLSIGPDVVKAVRRVTKLPLDTHLMIEHPEKYIAAFAEATNFLSVHAEVCADLAKVAHLIRAHKMRPAVVLNPETPFEKVQEALPHVDLLLIMSVNPGFGGQGFIRESLDKLRQARQFKQEHGLSYFIEIDGGITVENAGEAAAAGAEVLVSGSGIFKRKPYEETIRAMREAAEAALRAEPSA